MIEVELKMHITDIANTRKALLAEGYAISQERGLEISTMYDNVEQTMQHTNGRIRLRKTIQGNEFCYKLPIKSEGIKKEIELEVQVSDYKLMVEILEKMLFIRTTGYERYRTIFVKQNIKITLDEFPFDNFIEIEGDEVQILAEAAKLGYKKEDNLIKPCDTLFSEWRQSRGLPFKLYMGFDDYDK